VSALPSVQAARFALEWTMGEIELVHVDAGYPGDAAAGYRAAILLTVLGGLPLAFVAAAVLLATWRRAPRPWPPAAAVLFRLAFVVECAACMCSGLFLALLAVAAGPSPRRVLRRACDPADARHDGRQRPVAARLARGDAGDRPRSAPVGGHRPPRVTGANDFPAGPTYGKIGRSPSDVPIV
jgi:hypothetical protein